MTDYDLKRNRVWPLEGIGRDGRSLAIKVYIEESRPVNFTAFAVDRILVQVGDDSGKHIISFEIQNPILRQRLPSLLFEASWSAGAMLSELYEHVVGRISSGYRHGMRIPGHDIMRS